MCVSEANDMLFSDMQGYAYFEDHTVCQVTTLIPEAYFETFIKHMVQYASCFLICRAPASDPSDPITAREYRDDSCRV